MGLFNRRKKSKEIFENFPAIGGLMVSKMITEEGKKPLFMYREKRTRPEDSGWRIFSGFESQEYTDNPNNTGIYNPTTLLEIDSSIKSLLLCGVGSVFERESANAEWYEVYDYPLEDDFLVNLPIFENWNLEINNLFEFIEESDETILFTTGDKSLRIAFWKALGKSKRELEDERIQDIKTRDQSFGRTISEFDLSDDLISRVGYEIIERDDWKTYHVIYAFSIIDEEFLQMAFYFDNESDRSWAFETWGRLT